MRLAYSHSVCTPSQGSDYCICQTQGCQLGPLAHHEFHVVQARVTEVFSDDDIDFDEAPSGRTTKNSRSKAFEKDFELPSDSEEEFDSEEDDDDGPRPKKKESNKKVHPVHARLTMGLMECAFLTKLLNYLLPQGVSIHDMRAVAVCLLRRASVELAWQVQGHDQGHRHALQL
jgi:hypothetical protein